MNFKADKAFV